jgi:hypothetical protein
MTPSVPSYHYVRKEAPENLMEGSGKAQASSTRAHSIANAVRPIARRMGSSLAPDRPSPTNYGKNLFAVQRTRVETHVGVSYVTTGRWRSDQPEHQNQHSMA